MSWVCCPKALKFSRSLVVVLVAVSCCCYCCCIPHFCMWRIFLDRSGYTYYTHTHVYVYVCVCSFFNCFSMAASCRNCFPESADTPVFGNLPDPHPLLRPTQCMAWQGGFVVFSAYRFFLCFSVRWDFYSCIIRFSISISGVVSCAGTHPQTCALYVCTRRCVCLSVCSWQNVLPQLSAFLSSLSLSFSFWPEDDEIARLDRLRLWLQLPMPISILSWLFSASLIVPAQSLKLTNANRFVRLMDVKNKERNI